MNGFDWKTNVVAIVVAVLLFQWLIIVAVSLFSRKKTLNLPLLISSALLAVGWSVVFDVRTLFAKKQNVAAAAVTAPARPAARGTCASLKVGMTAAQVQEQLGAPDEENIEEDTRGPGAKMWRYRDSRCSIHLIDDKVEFID